MKTGFDEDMTLERRGTVATDGKKMVLRERRSECQTHDDATITDL